MSTLLAADEPAPVYTLNLTGRSPLLILCDHAGRRVPRALGDLGVPAAEMDRHIAWDIGAAAVSALLSEAVDAAVVGQVYSRLVIDCNRPPGHPTSIPPISDGTAVPGNVGLDAAAVAARIGAVFTPYHAAIAATLDARPDSVIIAMHSFTPVFGGVVRPWQAGVLHEAEPYALAVGEGLRAAGLLVGDNEPYRFGGGSDYTVPEHAVRRGLRYVELEIRQDLIANAEGQRRWASLLAQVLPAAL